VIRGATLLLGVCLCARQAVAATVTEVHYVMGTYFRATAEHADEVWVRRALGRCFAAARAADRRFSRFDQASELSRLNATMGTSAVAVSGEMAALLRRSWALQVATGGAFDVGVGSITGLWRSAQHWPTPSEIEQARRAAGHGSWRSIEGMLIRRPGVLLDLDGVAKGWAVDRCVSELRSAGVERALLNFGESSLLALGAPTGARGWEVVLRGLDGERALGSVTLRDQAMSVSAVFAHERQVGKRRVGHIVDPRSGQPLTSPAMAVVVAASATDAEAFSKALLVRGAGASRPLDQEVRANEEWITGAIVVRPEGVQRAGRIVFTASRAGQLLATVEPLQ
jgi:thiamine biosynthesis lipoprotein